MQLTSIDNGTIAVAGRQDDQMSQESEQREMEDLERQEQRGVELVKT